ncbi:helix-turn-helix domain-containing protein [Streptomyces sp. 351MFTsu5.1]|uniref:helix-turn-helix domain-containing protein n=1 Tax=Streptomyces sp. 351MFTsu5.1 TaxID=1172180 RepID=UPI0003609F7E|nr:PucR family transcriptional regulator [Streptomyces sp. 351MFTsu5.1]
MDTCTLGDLLDVVGGTSVRLHTAPAGLGAPVTEVLLYDPEEPLPRSPGALLLGVGTRAAAAGPLVRVVAEAGMTGLVLRGPDGPVAAADAHGVALLSVPEDTAWHEAHLLLASAIGARPVSSASGHGDLFALADAIAAATGGATAVEDPRRRILAYSTVTGQPVDEDRRQGILGLQVPTGAGDSEQYRTLFAAPAPLRLPALREGALPRLAMAVRAGGETLGSVWVVDDGTLAADAAETLVQGASTAALLLLRARAAQELARHRTGDLLRRVLDGTADPAGAAVRLGMEGPLRVAAFALDPSGRPDAVAGPQDAEQTGLRLLDVVRLQCEARYGRHACALVDGVVYAVLPAVGEHGGDRHRRLAEHIVARAGQALRVPVRAGLGEVVAGLGEVAGSRADADLVLRLPGPALPVATIDEVRARVTLARLTEVFGERRELSAGSWQRVLAHDERHGSDLARTLVCWFDAGCDMAGAAQLLAVHPNTCRYRLRQVRRLVGIDLDDPDERLVLWLQLRVLAGLGPVRTA